MRPDRRQRLLVSIVTAMLVASTGGAALAPEALSTGAQPTGFPPPESAAELRADLTQTLTGAGRPDLIPAPNATLHLSRMTVDGGVWVFASYRNVAGHHCLLEAVPGEGRGIGCQPRNALLAASPLAVSWGSRQNPGGSLTEWDVAWVTGVAAPQVAKVVVVSTECSTRTLEIGADGSFFGVFGESTMRRGVWPYAVQGLDSGGTLLAQRLIELEVPNAKGEMIRGPEVRAGCAAAS